MRRRSSAQLGAATGPHRQRSPRHTRRPGGDCDHKPSAPCTSFLPLGRGISRSAPQPDLLTAAPQARKQPIPSRPILAPAGSAQAWFSPKSWRRRIDISKTARELVRSNAHPPNHTAPSAERCHTVGRAGAHRVNHSASRQRDPRYGGLGRVPCGVQLRHTPAYIVCVLLYSVV